MVNKRLSLQILSIFIISFIAQIIFIHNVDFPMAKDAIFYDSVAQNILAGNGFSADGKIPTVDVKPGYTLFLAGIYLLFGHSILAVKIIQAVLISFACVTVFFIGKEVFNDAIGYISSLVMAFHPAFIVISSYVITESLFTFILSLIILFLVLMVKNKQESVYLYSAVILLGISTQIRPTTVFFPLAILIGLLFMKQNGNFKPWKIFFISTVIVILFLTPMAIRNFKQFRIFSPVEGMSILWLGSYVQGGASEDNPKTQKEFESIIQNESKDVKDKKIVEQYLSNVLAKKGIQNIMAHPVGYISLFPLKFFRLWMGSYSGYFNIGIPFSDFLHNPGMIKKYYSVLFLKSFVSILSILIFIFGVIGILSKKVYSAKTAPILWILCYYAVLHVLVYSNTRMGLPAVPYLIIFAVAFCYVFLKKEAIS